MFRGTVDIRLELSSRRHLDARCDRPRTTVCLDPTSSCERSTPGSLHCHTFRENTVIGGRGPCTTKYGSLKIFSACVLCSVVSNHIESVVSVEEEVVVEAGFGRATIHGRVISTNRKVVVKPVVVIALCDANLKQDG